MKKINRIVNLIFNYIFKNLFQTFGLICLLGAGNTFTFIFGLVVTILSFCWYCKEENKKWKD